MKPVEEAGKGICAWPCTKGAAVITLGACSGSSTEPMACERQCCKEQVWALPLAAGQLFAISPILLKSLLSFPACSQPCQQLGTLSSRRASARLRAVLGLGLPVPVACNLVFRALLLYLLQITLCLSQLSLSFAFCSMPGNFWLLIFQRHSAQLTNAAKQPQTA